MSGLDDEAGTKAPNATLLAARCLYACGFNDPALQLDHQTGTVNASIPRHHRSPSTMACDLQRAHEPGLAQTPMPLVLFQQLYAKDSEPEDTHPGAAIDRVHVGVFRITNHALDITVPMDSSAKKLVGLARPVSVGKTRFRRSWRQPIQPRRAASFPNQF